MNKEMKQFSRRLNGIGCTITNTGQHPKVYFGGKLVLTMPGSPSDWRTIRNCERDLRKAGVPV